MTDRSRLTTRWLLALGIGIIATVGVGTELLLRAQPTVDRPEELRIEGLPPLGNPAGGTCTRRHDDTTVQELRSAFSAYGRIRSGQVYACPAAYDGLRVRYAGEVIGEPLPRRGGVWVQVNDDDYALRVGPLGSHRELRGFNSGLAVWLPDGLHEDLAGFGAAGQRGDVILVGGRIVRADPADGGGTTLRADHLEVLSPAVGIDEPLYTLQAVVAGLLALVALALAVRAWATRRE